MNPKDLVGAKKAPLRYVPAAVVIEASGPMEDGALKYGPFNWREKPVEMVTYLEAIQRHLLALLDGQDNAEDSGHSHIGHIIAGAGIIADAKANGTLIDNRFAKGPAADMLRERDKSAAPAVATHDGPCAHGVPCVQVKSDRILTPTEVAIAQKIAAVTAGSGIAFSDDLAMLRGLRGEASEMARVVARSMTAEQAVADGLCCVAFGALGEHSLDCDLWNPHTGL
jgi:hypothetical protein